MVTAAVVDAVNALEPDCTVTFPAHVLSEYDDSSGEYLLTKRSAETCTLVVVGSRALGDYGLDVGSVL